MNLHTLVALLLIAAFAPRVSQASCVVPLYERDTILKSLARMKERYPSLEWSRLEQAAQSELAFTIEQLGEGREMREFLNAFWTLQQKGIATDFLVDAYLALARGDRAEAIDLARDVELFAPGTVERIRASRR